MGIHAETIEKVLKTIETNSMVNQGDRIAVAVSGGPDSVCLLDVLFELKEAFDAHLIVVHFDHGLRPGEGEAETLFVRSLAESYGLPFVTAKAHESFGTGSGFSEEKARRLRYQFFRKAVNDTSSSKIALGHNLDDQAETVIMRLLRGSGPSGLGGIPPCRENWIVRPLIELKRGDIEIYLNKRGLKFLTDPSNLDKSHLRNRIRLELIPLLKGYQPKVIEILGKTAEILRQDEDWLVENAQEWLQKNAEISNSGDVTMSIGSFKTLSPSLKNRIIRSALEITGGNLRGISQRHIGAVNRLAEGARSQAQVDLPGDLSVRKTYDEVLFTGRCGHEFDDYCYFLEGSGTYYLEELGCVFTVEKLEGVAVHDLLFSSQSAHLNGDILTFPLCVRNFRPGDRFVPLGMKGHRKVKDFFIDLKIPIEIRRRIPILTHKDRPVWICGLRIDNRYKVTPDTKRVLRIVMDQA